LPEVGGTEAPEEGSLAVMASVAEVALMVVVAQSVVVVVVSLSVTVSRVMVTCAVVVVVTVTVLSTGMSWTLGLSIATLLVGTSRALRPAAVTTAGPAMAATMNELKRILSRVIEGSRSASEL
jgi:hypothetical protein